MKIDNHCERCQRRTVINNQENHTKTCYSCGLITETIHYKTSQEHLKNIQQKINQKITINNFTKKEQQIIKEYDEQVLSKYPK